jgi:hypothetical protein
MMCPNVLQAMLVIDIGLYFEGECLAPFLYTGMTQACFQAAGTLPWLSDACYPSGAVWEFPGNAGYGITRGG